jgi:hypothetical protein
MWMTPKNHGTIQWTTAHLTTAYSQVTDPKILQCRFALLKTVFHVATFTRQMEYSWEAGAPQSFINACFP